MWLQNQAIFITDTFQYVLISSALSSSLSLFFFKTFLAVHVYFIFQAILHHFVILKGRKYPHWDFEYYFMKN